MKTLALVVALAAALINAGPASAADRHSSFLDRVASGIAGHDVSVYCEDDTAEWREGSLVLGYTYGPEVSNVVYLSPRVCLTLHRRIERKRVNVLDVALALHIFTHEAVHQRGGVFTECTVTDRSCEGRTDCEALRVDDDTSVAFGYRRTVLVRSKRKVGRRVITTVRVKPNPVLQDIRWYQRRIHNEFMAPEYRGDC